MNLLEKFSVFLVLFAFVPFIVTSVEPKVSPVITPLTITSLEKIGSNSTRIKGHAERLRSCSFIELRWSLGRRGQQSTKVQVAFEDKPTIRDGKTSWEGIIVGLLPDQIINNSHATVVYNCWGDLFPRTHQPFYDGDGKDLGLLYEQKAL